MSLQLEKRPVEWQGRTYEVCCNMAVLEELQDLHGGSMKEVFEAPAHTVTAQLFLIMLNRARRKAGEEPVTHEELAEEVSFAMLEETDVFGMFLRAMSAGAAKKAARDDAGKN